MLDDNLSGFAGERMDPSTFSVFMKLSVIALS
jgi:hypothetical protein